MNDPDPATTAALDACYASAADTIPEIVDTALAYARPLIEAAERQRIRDALGPELPNLRQLANWYDEDMRDIGPALCALAGLLDGDSDE